MTDRSLTICAIFRVPAAGRSAFAAYETEVLPFLADHGGVLERRLATDDRMTEIHLIRFPGPAAFDAYRADPRRSACAGGLIASGAAAEVLTMTDYPNAATPGSVLPSSHSRNAPPAEDT